MKSRFFLVPVSIASLLILTACEEQKPTEPASTAAPTQAAAPISDDDLAVQADFEEEAERTITVSSYKTELDALEKELESS